MVVGGLDDSAETIVTRRKRILLICCSLGGYPNTAANNETEWAILSGLRLPPNVNSRLSLTLAKINK